MSIVTVNEPIKVPGGWASPEEINNVRAALRQRRNYLLGLALAAEQRAAAIAADPRCSAEYLQTTRAVGVRWRGELATCERALELFAGIKYGARIEAMPSPEEEAAQEAAHLASRIPACWTPNNPDAIRQFAAQTDEEIVAELGRALSRDVTLEEARNVRATALAMLGPQEVPDAH